MDVELTVKMDVELTIKMTRTNNKGGVVSQGKEAESQSMEDVDHPGHSSILAKGHQPHSSLV